MWRYAEHRMISHRYYLYLCRGISWHKGCGTRTFNLSICAALGISCLNGCGFLRCGIIRWNAGPIISLWCIQTEMFTDIKRTFHTTIKGNKYEACVYLDGCSARIFQVPLSFVRRLWEWQRHEIRFQWVKRKHWNDFQIQSFLLDSKIKIRISDIKTWWDSSLRLLTN